MDLIMDGLLMAGTLFAGLYCWVLSRRVRDLKNLDSGLGGAIVSLTRQIELARATLEEAQAGAKENRNELQRLVAEAETVSGRLKLMMAATRDDLEPRGRADAAPRRAALSPTKRHNPLHALRAERHASDDEDDAPKARRKPDPQHGAPAPPPADRTSRGEEASATTPRVWPSLRSAPETTSKDAAMPDTDTGSDTDAQTNELSVPKPRVHLAPGGVLIPTSL